MTAASRRRPFDSSDRHADAWPQYNSACAIRHCPYKLEFFIKSILKNANHYSPANQNAVRLLVVLYSCVCVCVCVFQFSRSLRTRQIEMDLDSIYRRLSDISILLNRLLSDIKEHGDQLQLGGEQITLSLIHI